MLNKHCLKAWSKTKSIIAKSFRESELYGSSREADQRHSEMIVEQLGVSSSGGITTAGCQNEEIERSEQKQLLPDGDVTLFRGVAARANYLVPDRPDMLHTSEEVCREISKPPVRGFEKMTRIGKFFAGRPRVLWEIPNQEPQEASDI